MKLDDDDANLPLQLEIVRDISTGPIALRIPGAVATAATTPAAAAAFFAAAADHGSRSVYSDPAALRAAGSVETYTVVEVSVSGAASATSFDTGGVDGGGD